MLLIGGGGGGVVVVVVVVVGGVAAVVVDVAVGVLCWVMVGCSCYTVRGWVEECWG